MLGCQVGFPVEADGGLATPGVGAVRVEEAGAWLPGAPTNIHHHGLPIVCPKFGLVFVTGLPKYVGGRPIVLGLWLALVLVYVGLVCPVLAVRPGGCG